MKKFLSIWFSLFTAFTMAACGEGREESFISEQSETTGQPESNDDDDRLPNMSDDRYLVLYVSRTSNTERVAQCIRTILDCDILEIEPETPYDADYNAMLERAQEELDAIRQGNYPPIKTSVENFDDYETVFVGFPIWYGSMATPMQTFLHTYASKLAGKQIVLFATSGSSGISTSLNEARTLCPDAKVMDQPLLLTASALSQMEPRVSAWLDEIEVSRKEPDMPDAASGKINIMVGDLTITATIEDNAAGRDFLSRLPLEVTLNDYNNTTEKIFYPDPVLTTEGVTRGCTPTPGDITIYEPWGNVAIFCKSWSYNNDLIKIGHIDGDGIKALSVSGNISVRIEKP